MRQKKSERRKQITKKKNLIIYLLKYGTMGGEVGNINYAIINKSKILRKKFMAAAKKLANNVWKMN